MSAAWTKLKGRLWTGKLGIKMRGDSDCLAMAPYLLGMSNAVGFQSWGVATIAEGLGMPLARASEALRKLSEWGYVRVDPAARIVWVVEKLRHQCVEEKDGEDRPMKPEDNGAVFYRRLWLELKRDLPNSFLFSEIRKHYEGSGLEHLFPEEVFGSPLEDLAEPLPSPSEGVGEGLPNMLEGRLEMVEGRSQSKGTARKRAERVSDVDAGFGQFKVLYPKKQKIADALKAWRGIMKQKRRPWVSEILVGVERRVRSREWQEIIAARNGCKYIPLPGTWLRAAQWEDEGIPVQDDTDVSLVRFLMLAREVRGRRWPPEEEERWRFEAEAAMAGPDPWDAILGVQARHAMAAGLEVWEAAKRWLDRANGGEYHMTEGLK